MQDAFSSGWLIPIAVAVLPALVGLIGASVGRETRMPREIRILVQLSESLKKAPVGSDAHNAISQLVAKYAESVGPKLLDARKLNKTNVALTVFLVGLTLGLMYLLVQWIAFAGDWTILAVSVAVLVGLFFFLLNLASVTTWYNPSTTAKTEVGAAETGA